MDKRQRGKCGVAMLRKVALSLLGAGMFEAYLPLRILPVPSACILRLF